MNNKNNLNSDSEIKNTLKYALNNNNFNKLNKNIEFVAKDTISKLKETNKSHQNYRKFFVPVGKISAVLCTVFGSIGVFLFGISILVLTGLSLPFGSIFNGLSLFLVPFFILSLVLLIKGIKNLARLKRAKNYMYSMKGKSYSLITTIASSTGLKQKFIEKDLLQMINLGIFPQGHIDVYNAYFILDDKTYSQYLDLQEHIKEKKVEEETNNAKYDNLDPDIKRARDEGREFVLKIKKANDEIEAEEISVKLYKLQKVTEKIFKYVEQNPKKLTEIRKFSEYFLPTTLKLIDTYKNLDCEPIEVENISKMKLEIEETLDTINIAFENLLDSLFEDIAMDISTDISVLETMLIQEGLTDNIKTNNEKSN